MSPELDSIPLGRLALAFVPVLLVIGVLHRWSLGVRTTAYAVARMLLQLLLIGYFLLYIFEAKHSWIVVAVLTVMVFSSSWIALRTVPGRRRELYRDAFVAILLGGSFTLAVVTQGVLGLDPWYLPRYMIPLAGMIFANAMNSVSLAGERYYAELARGAAPAEARRTGLQASLIPITNSLFAVGLVSLPGMMTGQILSGISPLIAARYQIMVMCMVFGAAGIASACFLSIISRRSISAFENGAAGDPRDE